MKIKHGIFALLFAGCLAFAGTAQASIQAFTNLLTENWGVYNNTGTNAVPVIGLPITDLVEITVVSAAHSSVANANIGSIAGTSTSSAGPTTGASGLNSGQAAQGLAPPPLTFDNVTGPVGAWGEAQGAGSLVAPGGGVVVDPFGINASTVASVDLSVNPFSSNSGSADATTGVTAAFIVTNSGVPLPVTIVGDVFVQQLVDLTPVPPGASGAVDNSFTFTITDNTIGSPTLGQAIFSWSPDGILGPILGGTENSDPFSMNGGLTGFPGGTAGPNTFKTSGFTALNGGTAGVGGDPAPFQASFVLPVGTFSLGVQHSSDARALTIGVVPEPGACIAWARLSLCAGAGVYVRRRRSNHAS